MITRRTICSAGPEFRIKAFLNTIHHTGDLFCICFLTQLKRKFLFCFQCQIIPAVRQYPHIDLFAPVTPTPFTTAFDGQATLIDLPCFMQITMQAVINNRNKCTVSAIIILCIETIPTHRSQHLQRQLLRPVTGRNRSKQ